jgi:hypothetical protein
MKRATPAESEVPAIVHWSEAQAALADLKVVGCDLLPNKFGWVLKRLLDGKRFLVQGPPCTVVFAPAYQDPTKFKNNPQQPDPNRKRDKWNTTLRTTSRDFAAFCNRFLRDVNLQHMHDQRGAWGGSQYESPAELKAIISQVVDLDEKSMEMTFTCDLTAERGAALPNLVLKDFESESPLPEGSVLGQHSVIVPILDFSDVFIGKQTKSKQWVKMPTAFVKEIVSDTRVDANAIKRVKRDD